MYLKWVSRKSSAYSVKPELLDAVIYDLAIVVILPVNAGDFLVFL